MNYSQLIFFLLIRQYCLFVLIICSFFNYHTRQKYNSCLFTSILVFRYYIIGMSYVRQVFHFHFHFLFLFEACIKRQRISGSGRWVVINVRQSGEKGTKIYFSFSFCPLNLASRPMQYAAGDNVGLVLKTKISHHKITERGKMIFVFVTVSCRDLNKKESCTYYFN